VRLELTEQLVVGGDPGTVLAAAQSALARLFNLGDCTIDVASGTAVISSVRPPSPGEQDVIDAFARGIATSVDRVRLDREIDSARLDAALQSGRAAFLSAMTHNLRTPLATIKASVSTLLAHGDLDAGNRDALLVTARREIERLERLVTKVLHLSRIRADAVVVQREPADVAELIGNAVRGVWGLAAERDVRVVRASGAFEIVSVDPTLIEVALACVVENALRFAPPHSEVTISSAVRDGRCELRVVDHGPGIPPSERGTLFDEFVRGEGVRDATGAGIGLAIARAFVGAHEGEIAIQDSPGGGATFVISIPA
jgi:two-component system sensor histidine kinase KdpD